MIMQYAVLNTFVPIQVLPAVPHEGGENKRPWLFLSKLPIFHMGFDG